jgi:uncharacterized protein (TIGR02646 family)
MIFVQRSAEPPSEVRERLEAVTRKLCAAYDKNPTGYESGEKAFSFSSALYASASVKEALKKAQHNKCCFCESRVTHVAFGDVEHFRPKKGYKQRPRDELGRPGYYWLAYQWTNLLFCCEVCNRRQKQNLFPLQRPGRRALCHHHAIERERPLFIDPAAEDPAALIGFRGEYPYAIDDNRRGKATIDALGLATREELVEQRRIALRQLKRLRECRDLMAIEVRKAERAGRPAPANFKKKIQELDQDLERATHDSAEYAGMARAALA